MHFKTLAVSALLMLHVGVCFAQVTNTSYVTTTGEKVLRFEVIVPVDKQKTWEYFTKDELLKTWIAPQAHIELKTGGYIVTNYATDKPLDDPSSIRLGIINYLEKELITFKVELNGHFSSQLQEDDKNLQEIIQFIDLGRGKTKVISSMTGWGSGADWDKTYSFFDKGNEWTYKEFLKCFSAQK